MSLAGPSGAGDGRPQALPLLTPLPRPLPLLLRPASPRWLVSPPEDLVAWPGPGIRSSQGKRLPIGQDNAEIFFLPFSLFPPGIKLQQPTSVTAGKPSPCRPPFPLDHTAPLRSAFLALTIVGWRPSPALAAGLSRNRSQARPLGSSLP